MKKLKHNKLRNTGLIFEILTRNLMVETLNGKKPISIAVIKRHFTPDSELNRELKLYEGLTHQRNSFTEQFIDSVLSTRKKLNPKKLEEEKYNLVKSLKKFYNLDEFFKTRIQNYKLHASIYKLFESKIEDNPEEYFNTKTLVLEHISGKPKEETKSEYAELETEDPDVLKLGFKMIVEKFNQKYRGLNRRQKDLLSLYINGDPNSEDFKSYVYKEVRHINKDLTEISRGIEDEVIKIKLHEAINLSQEILKSNHIKDEHLDSMLKYYQLIEVLENE